MRVDKCLNYLAASGIYVCTKQCEFKVFLFLYICTYMYEMFFMIASKANKMIQCNLSLKVIIFYFMGQWYFVLLLLFILSYMHAFCKIFASYNFANNCIKKTYIK